MTLASALVALREAIIRAKDFPYRAEEDYQGDFMLDVAKIRRRLYRRKKIDDSDVQRVREIVNISEKWVE